MKEQKIIVEKKTSMSSYKAQVDQYGIPISSEDFKKLREYANQHGLKLSGFKDFVGDIETIKTVIDDICSIAEDFPEILDDRNGIWLELDYNLGTDFATTMGGHIIHLNAVYFSNLNMMISDYNECVRDSRFVRDTDWRAIIRHEVGHVVADMYDINPVAIAFELLNTKNRVKVLEYLTDELSIYSTEYDDGREIISECFSAHYSGVSICFADDFTAKCIQLSKKGGI